MNQLVQPSNHSIAPDKPETTSKNTDEEFQLDSEQLASLYKASADALRLDILRALKGESFSVQELCSIFALKQSGMSHHLKVLSNAGLISNRREGNFIFYQRSAYSQELEQHDFIQPLLVSIFASVDRLALRAEIKAGIQNVQAARKAVSESFFADNAAKFQSQQELIATFEQYGGELQGLLDRIELPRKDTVIEIGPGEGLFLQALSQRFKQVIALDSSEKMLEQSKQCAQQLSNVSFIHGDTQDAVKQAFRADCIVVNMVLHHTASPAAIFDDIAKMLVPGGSVLITELCRHDQAWVREACGDIWLGFSPSDLTAWAKDATLVEGQEHYLALRNGFTFQIRQFSKPLH